MTPLLTLLIHGQALHSFYAVMWGLFERRFQSIIRRLEKHRDLVHKEAVSIHFVEIKRQREEDLRKHAEIESQRQFQMSQDVYRWLSADIEHQEETLNRLSESSMPNSCEWPFKDKDIKRWIHEGDSEHAKSLLWLKGIPGSGKNLAK
jgi:hypothetical protein